ncbi:MAG: hypothetical protein HYX83_02975 [Chloroflexi bacterium]|nr:hypothetical protein [Chloroflexota bacterium]
MDTAQIINDLIHGIPIAGAGIRHIPLGKPATLFKGVTEERSPITVSLPVTIDDLPFSHNQTYDLSITAASMLSLPVVGSISGGLNRRVFVLERAAWQEVPEEGVTSFYGYAIRLSITVNKLTADMKLTLPYLAASAEIGHIEAKWMLQVIGLSGPQIDKVSIAPKELSVETFVLATQSLEALITAVRDSSTKFKPQKIGKKSEINAVELECGIG